ncbi:MAG TPA: hypothetical protein VK651_10790 [Blastocatellia bacterium]|nr:hypothetical protein [Blastocatellia bacterium]
MRDKPVAMKRRIEDSQSASIGLRAKTARAIAVVLGGQLDSPRVFKRVELKLADPAFPETSQPYHEVLDLPWGKAQVAVRKIATRIEKLATKELARLVREAQAEGLIVSGVGIVGAGDRNLEKIGSTHIRAHAAEGVLFREVLEVAAKANDLPNRRFDERNLDETAELELKLPIAKIKAQLAEMGRAAGSPWRADEKAAATAAWLALAAHRREGSK